MSAPAVCERCAGSGKVEHDVLIDHQPTLVKVSCSCRTGLGPDQEHKHAVAMARGLRRLMIMSRQ